MHRTVSSSAPSQRGITDAESLAGDLKACHRRRWRRRSGCTDTATVTVWVLPLMVRGPLASKPPPAPGLIVVARKVACGIAGAVEPRGLAHLRLGVLIADFKASMSTLRDAVVACGFAAS